MDRLIAIARSRLVVALTLFGLVMVFSGRSGATILIIDENFTGASGTTFNQWKINGGGAAFITHGQADGSTGTIVQLTPALNSQSGMVVYDTVFSTVLGFQVDFDYYMADGTFSGADGIAFFLVDGATTNVTAGTPGGALGYGTDYASSPGVPNGYFAVGFDSWGNAPASFGNAAGTAANGAAMASNSVALIGSGNGLSGYRYIAGTPYGSIRGGWRRASVLVHRGDGTGGCANGAICLSVKSSVDNGSTWTPLYTNYRIDNLSGQDAIPATMKIGFSASTGGVTDNHFIDNVRIYYEVPGYGLTITTSGTGSGSVASTSSPTQSTQIDCGSICTVAYPIFTDVTLTATASAGSFFTGWTGDCSGTSTSNQSMTAHLNCDASFTAGKTVSTSVGTHGSITPTSALILPGTMTSFTVRPDALYSIESVTGCGGTLVGSTYTTGAVGADCTVSATFKPSWDTTIKSKGGVAATGFGTFLGIILLFGLRVMSSRRLWVALPFALIFVPLTSRADISLYLSPSLGAAYTFTNSDNVTSEMNARGIGGSAEVTRAARFSWRILSGVVFTENFSVEGGYTNLGQIETQFNGSGSFDGSQVSEFLPLSGAGWETVLVGRVHAFGDVHLTARLGQWWWKSRYDLSGQDGSSQTIERSGSGLVAGFGLEGPLIEDDDRFGLRLEFDRYDLPYKASYAGFIVVSFWPFANRASSAPAPSSVLASVARVADGPANVSGSNQ